LDSRGLVVNRNSSNLKDENFSLIDKKLSKPENTKTQNLENQKKSSEQKKVIIPKNFKNHKDLINSMTQNQLDIVDK